MPENIDEHFYEAMRTIGGVRPAAIDGAVNLTSNADIVILDHNLVIEVKTLMEDPTEREEFAIKIKAIYQKWIGQPGVPFILGSKKISIADLPKAMGFELMQALAVSIRRAVKNANRQIRNVKNTLKIHDAHGILILCNAGAITFTPHVVLHSLYHALGHRHSSIDSTIFMTHGVPAHIPNFPEPVELFIQSNRDGHEPLPAQISEMIQNAWMQYQSRKQVIRVYEGVEGNILFNATNVAGFGSRA